MGAAIAIIGGGLILTLFVTSAGPPSTTRASYYNPDLAGHDAWPEVISRSSTSAALIGLVWSTNVPANVSLTPAAPCGAPLGVCPIGPPLFNWTNLTSGKGTASSGNASAFILEVMNPGTSILQFTGTVSVEYLPHSPLPTWAWGLIALGGVVMLAIVGVALFLGLFLPGGVYRDDSEARLHMRPPPGPPPEEPPPD